ncbi:MAG: hypothetical protein A3J62_04055 [Candidatus Buchananbacteria bacterium RIFCSPHIGHO2_02_FULL_38_8]|uniref:Endolytic murein transglycosylase n=2 Tax=Candidatus Buchananiibacteriota TaxID=1817903 RepID=A0A1G1Y2D0_9BACT|nr:MAG: hypothetical protein A2731_04270 [Candidatus Buchananbacteria bacterium RIFCSPHIGHO2_01_FULL_39_8]OGY47492.1 MAG: hypothetical protein A3J62_04055 [Candidatus Buchananbacteria bacterium RIFCSPHIGHO2_02_FULL_38_8]
MIDFLPRKTRTKAKNKLFYLIILIIVIATIYYFYNLNVANSGEPATKKFIVEAGDGVIKISRSLKSEELIKSPLIFQLYVWQKGISGSLQEGEYFLAQNLSIKEIAKILSRGAGVTKEKTLTFIEGWQNQDFAKYLAQEGLFSEEEFFAVVQKKEAWWDGYEILDSRPKNLDLEGYLFPDTYRVYSDATATDIVRKMLDNLDRKLTLELRTEIEKQGKTIHEILTIASILEKEVSTDADRKMVADIFYKRLAAGIPLQADSTVNYVTGKGVSRASAEDLEIDSPYNTYKYRGLPPGPICNPGLSSIMAAIYPTSNPYLYFLTTPDGKVIYSKTYEEHVAAKLKYYK